MQLGESSESRVAGEAERRRTVWRACRYLSIESLADSFSGAAASSTLDVCDVNGWLSALNPLGVVVVRKILECTSPVRRRSADGFASPEDAQSIAKPSARPCELIVKAGVCVRALSTV